MTVSWRYTVCSFALLAYFQSMLAIAADVPSKSIVSDAEEKRAWRSSGMLGKRSENAVEDEEAGMMTDEDKRSNWDLDFDPTDMANIAQLTSPHLTPKRASAWNGASGLWGKRASAWNGASGLWGKRASAWNGASGLWGKRASAWNGASGLWGKRSSAWNGASGLWGKRASAWNGASGLWGKRASPVWASAAGAWGKR